MKTLAKALILTLCLFGAGLAPTLASETLDTLFKALQRADSAREAADIESRIWRSWLEAPDEKALQLLDGIVASMSEGDYREALINSTTLTEDYPDYAEGWNKRATVYYLMANYDASVADIQQTLALEPRHFGAIAGLGMIFQQQNRHEEALAAFQQVLLLSPQSIFANRTVKQLEALIDDNI